MKKSITLLLPATFALGCATDPGSVDPPGVEGTGGGGAGSVGSGHQAGGFGLGTGELPHPGSVGGLGGAGGMGGGGGAPACATPADCPGQDGVCQVRTCVDGVCGVEYAPDGAPAGDAVAGDCMRSACDGAGGIVDVPEDTDTPDDVNDCTLDACASGVPSHTAVDAGAPCAQGVCDGAAACVTALVTDVDHAVLAHGARLVISGHGFNAVTGVTVGGIAQPFTVASDMRISLPALDDATPTGAQPVVVETPSGSASPLEVTVIRLQISEIDADTPTNMEMHEFVEITTGVPGVYLGGYTLVLWDGATDKSTLAIDLSAHADANGRLFVGGSWLWPQPALTLPPGALGNGPDAVAIHQGGPWEFAPGTSVTGQGVIDAVVYDTDDPDDQGLLDALISTTILSPARVQVNEAIGGPADQRSIQRCADGRRNGSRFGVSWQPSPGGPNGIVPCP